MSKTIEEQVNDDIHDLIVKAAQSILAYRDAQGLEQKPNTEHTVQLLLPKSPIRVKLVVTFPPPMTPQATPPIDKVFPL
jgi:hypothetical protein